MSSRDSRTPVARRQIQNRRRRGDTGPEPITGACEAADCTFPPVTRLFIPDAERKVTLCRQHAGAVEMQMRRNEAATKEAARRETEERLGVRPTASIEEEQ
jgi:8-oxo-dGTP pyrophosphatase MutT (NUDIX family)